MANLERVETAFEGKKVLVTGHTGFKGSWLCSWLEMMGALVYGASKDVPTEPSLFEMMGGAKTRETFWLDVCDEEALSGLLEVVQPEFVFHLAAQPLVSESYSDPVKTWKSNLLGTVSLLNAIANSSLTDVKIIMITSDKVYKNVEWPWGYREVDLLGGIDPYSASKAAAELAIQSFFLSGLLDRGGHKVCSVRAGNVIGGGDWAQGRVIPDLVRAWQKSEALHLRNPKSTRPWQHVLEPLSGYLLAGALLSSGDVDSGESFNFGPSYAESQTVLSVVKSFCSYFEEADRPKVIIEELLNHESGLLRLSSEKAHSQLGWKAALDFDETIRWTAEWYVNSLTNSSKDITHAQIRNYIALIDW